MAECQKTVLSEPYPTLFLRSAIMLTAGNIYEDLIAPFIRRRSKQGEWKMRLIIITTDLADKERERGQRYIWARLFVVKEGHKKGYWLAKKTRTHTKRSNIASIEDILSIRYIKLTWLRNNAKFECGERERERGANTRKAHVAQSGLSSSSSVGSSESAVANRVCALDIQKPTPCAPNQCRRRQRH